MYKPNVDKTENGPKYFLTVFQIIVLKKSVSSKIDKKVQLNIIIKFFITQHLDWLK